MTIFESFKVVQVLQVELNIRNGAAVMGWCLLSMTLPWERATVSAGLAAYLLELLDLGLLEHGEDVGTSLLSSPLSLIGGLLTRLGRNSPER